MRRLLPSPAEIAALPPDGGPEFNRLIHETSPYLRQHAANPVDWYPWGEAAFARARTEDKPLFLSAGYSSCHWCHVMEHESFEDASVAEILNRAFIAIKVDREERPDLDEIYLAATQLLTGQGGWPNSVWLTPDGRPWFAGTYFPREDRYGRAGFRTVLLRVAELWQVRRAEVEAQADELSRAVREALAAGATGAARGGAGRALVDEALAALRQAYDPRHGGFGGAPKFPPHTALALLLHEHRRTGARDALDMATGTLDAMAAGGFRDHLGGGFHRYSTDAAWFLPHFEKMLYDNAQLARNYAEAWAVTGRAAYHDAARDTLDWVLREMTHPEGGFYSALDADSEGEEGRFYLWRRDEVLRLLDPGEDEAFCAAYGIRAEGNFQDEAGRRATGLNILHLVPRDDLSRAVFADARGRLLAARTRRERPFLDDKILTAWNGLMIGAMACAGRLFGEPRYLEAALRAAACVRARLVRDGELLHTWREGAARVPAFLDDHAALALAYLDLHEATGDASWLREAEALGRRILERFRDPAGGGLFNTSDRHEQLLARVKDGFDQAVPSGNALAAQLFLRLAEAAPGPAWRREAEAVVAAFEPAMRRAPTGAAGLLLAASRLEPGEHVKILIEPAEIRAAPGATADVQVRMILPAGYHVWSHAVSSGGMIGLSIALEPDGAATLARVDYPPPTRDGTGDDPPLPSHEGEMEIPVTLQVRPDAPAARRDLRLHVTYQACGPNGCLPLETRGLFFILTVS